MQASLFDQRRSALDDLFSDLDDTKRWYQQEAEDAVFREWERVRSTLLVAATGTGKSVIARNIAKRLQGNVMMLAHRDELIGQARDHIALATGDYVDVEQASEQSSFRSRFVVGSVQSVMQKKRLERMGHDRFQYLIIDEGHHAPSPSYRKILDWFGPAKVLLLTATPDRADEKAMGQVADSVAYVYDIEQGVDDGFLVPLKGHHVDVKQVDLRGVKSSKGDLAEGELDEVMTSAVAGIVSETLRLYPERQAVVFWPGVRSSQLAAQTFNERIAGSAIHVDASTDRAERKELLRDFNAGRYRYFNNVGIATEGWDCPTVSLVVHGRPTKSRSLYAQMTGRGTRVLPGLVDHLRLRDQHGARRALISASSKPDTVLLDFVANSGKHDLVTPEDLLGGKYTDDEVALAKKARKLGTGVDPRAELEKARSELRRLASMAKTAKVSSVVREFDPFRAFGLHVPDSKKYETGFGNPIPTGLWDALVKKGVQEDELRRLSKGAAGKLYTELKKRTKENLCTLRQAHVLQKYGIQPLTVSFSQATEAIDYIASTGWRPDPSKLHAVVTRQREPGE